MSDNQPPGERVDEIATELAEDLRRSIPIRGIAKHYAQLEAENEHMAQVVKAARDLVKYDFGKNPPIPVFTSLRVALSLLDQEPSPT